MERCILEVVSVLDITHVIAGPLCGRMLADLGADVIKVDRLPPDDAPAPVRTDGAGAVAVNLGKRSITIDLGQPSGVEVGLDLARRADVVIENFRPGAMARLGLGYEQLAEQHPRVIYASVSGFGQTGAQAERRAFGSTAHAEAGLLWVQQRARGDDAPFAPGLTIADIVTGMNAFSGILAALYDREQTGRGQHIDVSLVESQFAMLVEAATAALNDDAGDAWRPHRHPIFKAKDGRVCINPGGPRVWPPVAAGLGHPGVEAPPSLDQFHEIVAPWVAELTVDEIVRGMEAAGAPFGVVRSMPEAVRDPYFEERGMIVELPDPLDGSVRVISSPLHFSESASGPTAGAPLAGEHTREILASDLGYAASRIDELLASGVVVAQGAPQGVER